MTVQQGVFIFTALFTLFAALMVVSRRNMVHAALSLVVSLFGIAVMFVLLEAGFLAVVQVLVYIGAIAILMIFAVMLTRRRMDVDEETAPTNRYAWLAAGVAVLLFAGLTFTLSLWPKFTTLSTSLPVAADPLRQLGQRLVAADGYVIPFEVASMLLLVALIGALVVAFPRKER